MVHTHRQHHYVGRVTFWLLQPFFRYSTTRQAWVLRMLGERHGPVLRKREDRDDRA